MRIKTLLPVIIFALCLLGYFANSLWCSVMIPLPLIIYFALPHPPFFSVPRLISIGFILFNSLLYHNNIVVDVAPLIPMTWVYIGLIRSLNSPYMISSLCVGTTLVFQSALPIMQNTKARIGSPYTMILCCATILLTMILKYLLAGQKGSRSL